MPFSMRYDQYIVLERFCKFARDRRIYSANLRCFSKNLLFATAFFKKIYEIDRQMKVLFNAETIALENSLFLSENRVYRLS